MNFRVARAPLVALALALLTVCGFQADRMNAEGDWQGDILLQQVNRKVAIHFTRGHEGLLGTIDIPATMSFGVPVADLHWSDSSVQFTLHSSGPDGDLRFQGQVGGGSLRGSVSGEHLRGSFEMRRCGAVQLPHTTPLARSWKPELGSSWPVHAWLVTSPARENLDSARLSVAERHIAHDLPEVRSLVIVRHGRIAFERYFRGATRNEATNVKSVTKSFTSALIGIALREHVLGNLDQTVAEFLPEYFGPATDTHKRKITLRHLLTMTAGFEWIENGPSTFAWHRSPDFAKFAIDLPLAVEPGQTGRYNTSLSHLLSIILTRKSGLSAREFAEKYLFGPVGIRVQGWGQDPQGYTMGGIDLYLTPRDMARFGLLYLNLGLWKDRQVVPAAWVRESMAPAFVRDPLLHNYGYLWWLVRDDDLPAFAAIGYGGQLIYVCPKLDLVVAMTSTTVDPHNDVLEFVRRYITPAVKSGPS